MKNKILIAIKAERVWFLAKKMGKEELAHRIVEKYGNLFSAWQSHLSDAIDYMIKNEFKSLI